MHRRSAGGDRLAIANVPTNMLSGLLLLGAELGVDSDSWLAGLHLSQDQLHDPRTRISYRQAYEVIRRALPMLPIDAAGLAMGGAQNGGNFGLLGLLIVGLFAVSWAVSVAVYREKRYDEAEAEAA